MPQLKHTFQLLSVALCCSTLSAPLWAQTPAAPGGTTPSLAPMVAAAAAMGMPAILSGDERPKIRSLLFTAEEITAIRSAISAYKKMGGVEGEDFLDKLTGIQDSSPQFYVYPQFFLESIVYHSSKDWAIWLNNEKITQDTAKNNPDFTIEAINENRVAFKWHPSMADKDRVMEIWKKAPHPGITVDPVSNTVEFSLHTNQTFSSYVMHVLEGKVLPVQIDLNKELLEDSSAAATAAIPAEIPTLAIPPAAVPQPAGTSQGLPGLIGAYEKIDNPAPQGDKKP